MRSLLLIAAFGLSPGLVLADPVVDSTTHPIRNGTRAPQVIPLTDAQQRAIGWLASSGSPSSPFCTGTLVAERVIVTAAHCTRGKSYEEIVFGVGVDPASPDAVFSLIQLAEFPDEEIDAALLFLGEDATAAADVEPMPVNRAALDGADVDALIGRQVEVAGYGETFDASLTGRFFASVALAEINEEFVVVDGQGLQGLCFGDSGGPVITMNAAGAPVILGVEHGGDDSCVGRDFLTRLDPLGDWLEAAFAATTPLVEVGGPCGGLDFRGQCMGNIAQWCDESGRVASIDCGAHDRACGYIDDQTGYYCTTTKACETGPDGLCIESPEGAGFISDGAQRVQFVGGCSVTSQPLGSSGWFWLLGFAALIARRRR